jgi:hypothetical protein
VRQCLAAAPALVAFMLRTRALAQEHSPACRASPPAGSVRCAVCTLAGVLGDMHGGGAPKGRPAAATYFARRPQALGRTLRPGQQVRERRARAAAVRSAPPLMTLFRRFRYRVLRS